MAGKPDFSQRSYEKELLDRDDIPFADIERNMRELDIINTWLGGHAISIRGLKDLLGVMELRGMNRLPDRRRRISMCEIGCGGGENLRVLDRGWREEGMTVGVTCIDNNA